MCTGRHYLPFDIVQGRPVRGAGSYFYSPEFIVAPLEAHAAHQNSFLLHVLQLEFGYQGNMYVILSHSTNGSFIVTLVGFEPMRKHLSNPTLAL